MNLSLKKKLTQEIYELAGEEFNINSPKQLVNYFWKLGLLEYAKKTKTGFSTVDVLVDVGSIAPIVKENLDYRQVLDSNPPMWLVCRIGFGPLARLYSICVQDLTQTGRLSSVDPNLQNIPVRLEQGRHINRLLLPEWEDKCPS